MLNKDTLLMSVLAASGGKMAVKYNKNGDPLFMVRIPKFNLEDIDAPLGSGPHPAFIAGGEVEREIYIGAFQAIIEKGCALPIPGQLPKVNITFDDAKAACAANGPGFHLMTARERAAIALWSMKNGTQPRGNTQYGRAYEAAWETGVRPDGGNPGSTGGDPKTLTGSGPASWRHDSTPQGIAGLSGNVWEWNNGMKLADGRFYFPEDNSFTLAESGWPASPVYLDSSAGPGDRNGAAHNGTPALSNGISKYSEPPTPAGGSDTGDFDYTHNGAWKSLTVSTGYDGLAAGVRQKMAQLLVAPKLTSEGSPIFAYIKGGIWARNCGTRFPLRGGSYSNAASAGLGALYLNYLRAIVNSNAGFRPALPLSRKSGLHGGRGSSAAESSAGGKRSHIPSPRKCGENINRHGRLAGLPHLALGRIPSMPLFRGAGA
jgi:hypothetical protein